MFDDVMYVSFQLKMYQICFFRFFFIFNIIISNSQKKTIYYKFDILKINV